MQPIGPGIRTSGVGLAANVVLALTKISAGVFGHSQALIADGIESTADVIGSLVVLGGLLYASRPADEDHPFGHGKAESAAGLMVGVSVLAAAGLIAWASLRAINVPPLAPAGFTLVVLGAIILLKEALYRWVIRVGEQIDSAAVRADAWHHRLDAVTSLAAFVGIAIAQWGGPGWEAADAWAAFLASLVIAYNGLRLLQRPIAELMDASADAACVATIRATAAAVPGVVGVGRCRVRKSGLELLADLHLKVPGDITVTAGHDLAHEVEARLRKLPRPVGYVSIHVEPARPKSQNPFRPNTPDG